MMLCADLSHFRVLCYEIISREQLQLQYFVDIFVLVMCGPRCLVEGLRERHNGLWRRSLKRRELRSECTVLTQLACHEQYQCLPQAMCDGDCCELVFSSTWTHLSWCHRHIYTYNCPLTLEMYLIINIILCRINDLRERLVPLLNSSCKTER